MTIGKQFNANNATGEIGVNLLATFGLKNLGVIARHQLTDVGVDIEFEFLNQNGFIDGLMLKVQVKSTAVPPTGSEYISLTMEYKDIHYLARLPVPAIICFVSTSDEAIWWKAVDDNLAINFHGIVHFHRDRDRLTAASRDALRNYAMAGVTTVANNVLGVYQFLQRIELGIHNLDMPGDWDTDIRLANDWIVEGATRIINSRFMDLDMKEIARKTVTGVQYYFQAIPRWESDGRILSADITICPIP
ncbi:DUF4365 domain-containing protein [Nitrospirillum sp. BR 11752]|uniref:DUF4365 domain-containing protein n=1 Tax=Nitrospirillum sp. BR 11752 TaxID=3104293 RepID=UPI002EA04D58|nr:DUF4365 domain-containing protein [Nitrospirillum sp. BR 11752]